MLNYTVVSHAYEFNLHMHICLKNKRTFLVIQWLRICLPMQGTQVQSLVLEDPTCQGAAISVRHNY